MLGGVVRPLRRLSTLVTTRGMSAFVWDDKEAAELYYRTRPPYEMHVIPWILEYYFQVNSPSNSRNNRIPFALDVGCGSGQLTVELAKYCDRVIGIDPAERQISVGQTYARRPNVEYRIGRAESLVDHCEADEADLVVAGTAAHFFDTDEFVTQVKNCLRPSGVVGLVGYFGHGYVHEDNSFKHAFDDFLKMQLGEKPGYDEVAKKLKSCYRSIEFPFSNVRLKEDTLDLQWTFDQVHGFMSSGKHLFRYPERKVIFPGDGNDPKATATVRLHLFGLIGHA